MPVLCNFSGSGKNLRTIKDWLANLAACLLLFVIYQIEKITSFNKSNLEVKQVLN